MQIRTRLRLGVYWDEHCHERRCAIIEMINQHGEITLLGVLDAKTGQPVLDPVEAIPLATTEPQE